MQPVGTNGLAIASLVVSLAGGCFYSLGGIVGIILGIVALNQIKQTGQQGRGLAIAGIAVGAAFLAIFAVILVVALIGECIVVVLKCRRAEVASAHTGVTTDDAGSGLPK